MIRIVLPYVFFLVACTYSNVNNAADGGINLYVKNKQFTENYKNNKNALSLNFVFENNTNEAVCFDASELSGNFVIGIRVYENEIFLKPSPSGNLIDQNETFDKNNNRTMKVYYVPPMKNVTGWATLHTMYKFTSDNKYHFEYTIPIINCSSLDRRDIIIPPSPTLFVTGVIEFQDMKKSEDFTKTIYPAWAENGEFIEMERYTLSM